MGGLRGNIWEAALTEDPVKTGEVKELPIQGAEKADLKEEGALVNKRVHRAVGGKLKSHGGMGRRCHPK